MRLLLFAGFLGSGKTTLVLALARQAALDHLRVCVLVNEVGEVGLPYDIKLVSAGEDEIRETYIEVKATVEERTDGGGAHFFISREELAAAEREGEAYHIYFVTAAASPHAALVRIVDPAQKWEEKQVKMCMFA